MNGVTEHVVLKRVKTRVEVCVHPLEFLQTSDISPAQSP